MRFCRFDDNRLGLVEATSVRDVTAALDVLPAARYPYPTYDVLIAHLDEVGARARQLAPSAPVLALDRVTLRSPVANPGKLVGCADGRALGKQHPSPGPAEQACHPGPDR